MKPKEKKETGIIDFEKAYDKVSWKFLLELSHPIFRRKPSA
jgi:hypothetical protein